MRPPRETKNFYIYELQISVLKLVSPKERQRQSINPGGWVEKKAFIFHPRAPEHSAALQMVSNISYLWINVPELQTPSPKNYLLQKRSFTEIILKRSIWQMCCNQMRKWKKFSIWCFLHPLMAAWHMINDCSPQHFTLAHFTDGLPDKKALPLCVCGAASAGCKNWNLWPLGRLMVVWNGALPYFGTRCRAKSDQLGNTEANFMELFVWLGLRIFTQELFGTKERLQPPQNMRQNLCICVCED